MTSFIVDTFAWIAYFDKTESFKSFIEESILYTPVLAIAEMTKVLKRRGEKPEKIDWALSIVFERSLILPLDFQQARKAGALAVNEKMHLTDAIAYSYASEDQPILTGDPHFRGKPFVKFVER